MGKKTFDIQDEMYNIKKLTMSKSAQAVGIECQGGGQRLPRLPDHSWATRIEGLFLMVLTPFKGSIMCGTM